MVQVYIIVVQRTNEFHATFVIIPQRASVFYGQLSFRMSGVSTLCILEDDMMWHDNML